jgi:penicillin-binding protein-related factor A (putative recombinase)
LLFFEPTFVQQTAFLIQLKVASVITFIFFAFIVLQEYHFVDLMTFPSNDKA